VQIARVDRRIAGIDGRPVDMNQWRAGMNSQRADLDRHSVQACRARAAMVRRRVDASQSRVDPCPHCAALRPPSVDPSAMPADACVRPARFDLRHIGIIRSGAWPPPPPPPPERPRFSDPLLSCLVLPPSAAFPGAVGLLVRDPYLCTIEIGKCSLLRLAPTGRRVVATGGALPGAKPVEVLVISDLAPKGRWSEHSSRDEYRTNDDRILRPCRGGVEQSSNIESTGCGRLPGAGRPTSTRGYIPMPLRGTHFGLRNRCLSRPVVPAGSGRFESISISPSSN